ncbi:efflux RND transporter periplasmic adaptor subunit [Polaribacter litorisediminis]|uniref:efflux RND transporter periplasmic adaptor subunit n=1 Tax=Polaribacter litorisediminis TaxID=1908341 RepID=UPI001CBEE367|nr:efflux RND transporter periplasmic adaptor subunit [Polaribacter litorisediminis]UAM98030.1 efflux RND transporter periplasmic adaptor subunit [Polaribacter litorisediminis]
MNLKFYFILILIIYMFSKCKNNEIVNNEDYNDISYDTIKVLTKKIDVNYFNKKILFNGKINYSLKSDLRFTQNNIISSIKTSVGEIVKYNQVLGLLENKILENSIEKAKIELQKAKYKFEEEKINFGNNITKSSFENLKIRSGLFEAQNNLDRAQIEYNQTILKAPFSGIIANLEKKEGDFITTADVFCTLINPNKLEVFFSVLENEFQFVSIGQEIEILSFVNNDESLKGRITEINPLVDKNGLIKIKAKVLSKETNLLDGMNVKVLINKPLKDVIVIPKEALVLRSNRQVVFTLEKGLAKWNYVEVAGENNNSYAIKKGLKVSDTIIVSGNLNLSHDAKVNATFIEKEVYIK